MLSEWPRLEGRVSRQEGARDDALCRKAMWSVSVHACGALTDRVIDAAVAAGARLAVLPCCHDLNRPKRVG